MSASGTASAVDAIEAAPARGAGRPRSAEADAAILAAAIEEFAEHGYEGLRVEAIAERAGVAKSTLYRRYPNKTDLLQAALWQARSTDPPVPHTDSLEQDLFVVVRRLRDTFASDDIGRLIPTILEAGSRHPEFASAHREYITERRRGGLERVAAAITDGDLPDDTDVQLFMDMAVGAIFYRSFVSGAALDDDTLHELVRQTLRAHRR